MSGFFFFFFFNQSVFMLKVVHSDLNWKEIKGRTAIFLSPFFWYEFTLLELYYSGCVWRTFIGKAVEEE